MINVLRGIAEALSDGEEIEILRQALIAANKIIAEQADEAARLQKIIDHYQGRVFLTPQETIDFGIYGTI